MTGRSGLTCIVESLKARLRRIEMPAHPLSSIMLRLQAESNGE